MKKIIYVLGIIFLVLIILLNFIFTAHLDMSEHISINVNSLIYIIGIILLTIFMLAFTKYINKYLYSDLESNSKRKIRSGILIFSLAIYIIFMIAWLVLVRPGVGGDSIHVANLAQTFLRWRYRKISSQLDICRNSIN